MFSHDLLWSVCDSSNASRLWFTYASHRPTVCLSLLPCPRPTATHSPAVPSSSRCPECTFTRLQQVQQRPLRLHTARQDEGSTLLAQPPQLSSSSEREEENNEEKDFREKGGERDNNANRLLVMMMMSVTRGGEGLGDKNEYRKATRS